MAEEVSMFKELLLKLESEHLRELKLLEENLQTANRLCRLHRLDAARDGGSRCFEEEDVVAREDLPISRFPMLRLTSGSTFELSQDTMEYQEGAASGAVKYEEGAAPPHQVKFEEGTTTAATAPAQAVAVIPTMSSQGEGPLPRFGSSGSLNGSFFEADSYELCMGILILVSVMVLALEMQYEGYVIGYELQYPKLIHPPEEVWHQWPVVLRWMDRTFTGLFVLDIMMRVCVLRLRFFCQTLNLLDFVVVSCSLMEDIFGDNFPVNAPFLRLLRFAKVARSLRVLKRAHILGSLHLLLKSVRASVASGRENRAQRVMDAADFFMDRVKARAFKKEIPSLQANVLPESNQGLLKQKKLCQTAILTPHKEMAVPDGSVEVSCKDTCGRLQGSTEAFEGKDPEVRQEVFRPLEWIWRGLGFTNEAAKHGKPTSG
ncbi:unnamed protein product [Durusdinium trenchii]|uniref:Ion transport domain-containing protein n=1 Tax=Durusdinium trenchii TaxID=1381693 RepID=A0ABP0R8G3_9DINO